MILKLLTTFIARKRAAHTAYRKVVDELSAFTDRELLEINISSADIHYLATQQALKVEEHMLRAQSRGAHRGAALIA